MDLYNTFLHMVDATKSNMLTLAIILAIMWGFFFITVFSDYKLLFLGIHPRKLFGLVGIIFCPFLHAGFNHIFFNCFPLLILSDFLLISGLDYYLNISLYLIFASGVLVWLFGRPLIHVGASSLITGYWSFLVINAYSQGGAQAIILAIVSVYYFASIFLGIFPNDKGVSWEGHMSGFVSGIALNYSINFLPAIEFSSFFSPLLQTAPVQ